MHKSSGLTLFEILFIVVFICLLLAIFLPALTSVNVVSHPGLKCKSNLDQLGKSLKLYTLDFGRSTRYPEASGQGFFTVLYFENILVENTVYICDATRDENAGIDLSKLPDYGEGLGPISYAGRMNRNYSKYPGIFAQQKNANITTLASDDWNDGKIENHENGDLVLFLFLDGHSDHVKSRNANFANYSFNYNPLAN